MLPDSRPRIAAQPGTRPSPTRTGVNDPTVLVATSNRRLLRLIHNQIASAGLPVLGASNGHDALLVCRQSIRPIRLLVTGLDMPDMPGTQLASLAGHRQPDLPVLFLADGPDAPACPPQDTQRWEMMALPFQPEELLGAVRRLLAGAPRHRA